ncbi:AMIN-like domain-containing (lipo)protein [Rhodococcus sp. OK519]|uniref:AMIN-like domain-containing (lipo)protein n=1 Tax=Rhodococcus sp. OK519 TaxID=2135729 RepID=UPI0011B1FFFF
MKLVVVCMVVCVAALPGCAAGQEALQSGSVTESIPADRTGRVHFGPTPPPSSTDLVSAPGTISTAAVDDVRVEVDPQTGIERVVYRFAGAGIPFWKVGYVAEAHPYRGGPQLSVAGRSILQVDIMDTALPARHLYGEPTPLVGPEGARVTQLYLLPDARDTNGITQSFIGIGDDHVAFEVVAVDDPPRLIVELG